MEGERTLDELSSLGAVGEMLLEGVATHLVRTSGGDGGLVDVLGLAVGHGDDGFSVFVGVLLDVGYRGVSGMMRVNNNNERGLELEKGPWRWAVL